MREMVGGCCVCSDERGWSENPLVYCDGHGCNVAVHQGSFACHCCGLFNISVCSPIYFFGAYLLFNRANDLYFSLLWDNHSAFWPMVLQKMRISGESRKSCKYRYLDSSTWDFEDTWVCYFIKTNISSRNKTLLTFNS